MLKYQYEVNINSLNRHDPDKLFEKHVNIIGHTTEKRIINAPEMGIFQKEVDLPIPIMEDAENKTFTYNTQVFHLEFFEDDTSNRDKLIDKLIDISNINIKDVDPKDELVAIWLKWNDGEYGMSPVSQIENNYKFIANQTLLKNQKHIYLTYHIGIVLYYSKKVSDNIPILWFDTFENESSYLKEDETKHLHFLYDTQNQLTLYKNEYTIGNLRMPKIIYNS
jgi:hypothetical protein